MVEYGIGQGGSLFGGQSHQLHIFDEGIGNPENELFPYSKVLRGLNRSTWTLWLDSVGWERLETRSGTRVVHFLCIWHLCQLFR
jgi:hypothetical protein